MTDRTSGNITHSQHAYSTKCTPLNITMYGILFIYFLVAAVPPSFLALGRNPRYFRFIHSTRLAFWQPPFGSVAKQTVCGCLLTCLAPLHWIFGKRMVETTNIKAKAAGRGGERREKDPWGTIIPVFLGRRKWGKWSNTCHHSKDDRTYYRGN